MFRVWAASVKFADVTSVVFAEMLATPKQEISAVIPPFQAGKVLPKKLACLYPCHPRPANGYRRKIHSPRTPRLGYNDGTNAATK
jgi:hypothetical protein